MNSARALHSWEKFLKFYSQQYQGHRTRLGLFQKEGEITTDYWVEDGLKFVGIDSDLRTDVPTIEILLEGYSHSAKDVERISVHLTLSGEEDGIDLVHRDGTTTILRFETS